MTDESDDVESARYEWKIVDLHSQSKPQDFLQLPNGGEITFISGWSTNRKPDGDVFVMVSSQKFPSEMKMKNGHKFVFKLDDVVTMRIGRDASSGYPGPGPEFGVGIRFKVNK
jgi:hypothetical protein